MRAVRAEPHIVGIPYVVRKIADHGLACMAVVSDIQQLWDITDEVVGPDLCEFSPLTDLVIEWPAEAPVFPLEWDQNSETYRTDEPGSVPTLLAQASLMDVGTSRSAWGSDECRWLPLDSSYVYAARSAKRLKIGFSTDVQKRIHQLNKGSAHRVELVAKMRGDFIAEERLLENFDHLRVNGEWLEVSEDEEYSVLRKFEGYDG